jgi:transposase
MTFRAALRHDRIDGPINAESFRLYVEEVLVAALKPGDIVVLDNLGSHKGKTIRDNPIEQVFAKLKHLLRKDRRGDLAPDRCAP